MTFSVRKQNAGYSPFDVNPTPSSFGNGNGSAGGEETYSSRHFNSRNMGNGSDSQTITRRHVSDNQVSSILDRRHLEDVTNHHQSPMQQQTSHHDSRPKENNLIIDDALKNLDPVCFCL